MNMIVLEKIGLEQVKTRCVAIVRFGPAGLNTDGFRAGEYYQVTIDPKKCSPSGEFIRFGTYNGDEIVGWQRCDAISVVDVIAEWPDDAEQPLLRYADSKYLVASPDATDIGG